MIRILGLVTCFNRKEKTKNTLLKLVHGNENVNFNFIVVDDKSNDGTFEMLQSISNVQIINGNGNLFYSGGMRKAINIALRTSEHYDYCMLFNDDVDFYSKAIENLVKQCNKTIIVGPTCEKDGHTISYGGVIKTSKWRPSFKIVMSTSKKILNCDTFNANCVLIPWNIFVKMGNMDEKYTHSLGDFDYGLSARKKGFKITVLDQFVGMCENNRIAGSWADTSLTRLNRLKKKECPKGLPRNEWFYYLKKNYSYATAMIYSIIPYIRILFGF